MTNALDPDAAEVHRRRIEGGLARTGDHRGDPTRKAVRAAVLVHLDEQRRASAARDGSEQRHRHDLARKAQRVGDGLYRAADHVHRSARFEQGLQCLESLTQYIKEQIEKRNNLKFA